MLRKLMMMTTLLLLALVVSQIEEEDEVVEEQGKEGEEKIVMIKMVRTEAEVKEEVKEEEVSQLGEASHAQVVLFVKVIMLPLNVRLGEIKRVLKLIFFTSHVKQFQD